MIAAPVNINDKTPNELLSEFYKNYNLGDDGGQSSSYVKIDLTKNFYFYFPNFDARRKAVLKHDIHHLVTGYESIMKGETEISTWEIASGCKNYWAAFIINMQGMIMGIPMLNINGIFKAFKRGRRTENLYTDVFTEVQVLNMKISEIRAHLKLDTYDKDTDIPATFEDFLYFISYLILGECIALVTLLFLPFVVLYTLYVIVFKPK